MKRFHVHVGVKDLATSIEFYSTLFGQAPIKTKDDYAKWLLDDPKLNFAISTRTEKVGIDHVGIQVEEQDELDEIKDRLIAADLKLFDVGETTCCYAKSTKAWVKDPGGIAWEAYQNINDVEIFSKKSEIKVSADCCVPSTNTAAKSRC